ncbi:MarR family winged helix-turn-helix transcriptional regulator [Arthrobacter sp. BF1]|uniref:MarR family winged helix-turn-helix transcriptional regulator n=1 Tax=Arthrobacter sp. BF1 TaxID=2821145 RepID=UPI001C4EDD93|nr:MarR family transcriptional regulator [Arthrobacter sp. BF1]
MKDDPALLDRQLEHDAETTNYEYSVLARLSMAPELTLRLSDLATQCDSSQPRMSKVMVRFEQRGWVARSPDPNNGRYTLATLTEVGMQKAVTSAPGHVNRVRELVFDPLSVTQQHNLGIALSRIAETVREQLDNCK